MGRIGSLDYRRGAGYRLPDGEYVLGDQRIFVQDGAARLKEGNLAGSTLTLLQAVANMVGKSAYRCRMPSVWPASIRPSPLDLVTGLIQEGNQADFASLRQA